MITFQDRFFKLCGYAWLLSNSFEDRKILGLKQDEICQANYPQIRDKIQKYINNIKYELKLMQQTSDEEEEE